MKKKSSRVHRLLLLRTLITGIFGGIFTGVFFIIFHFFNMTEVKPKTLLNLLFQDGKWLEKWYAYLIFLLLLSILSTVIALIYYFLLKQRKSWITGAVYGIITWGVVYFILPVIIMNYNPFLNLDSESHVSMLCLFVLYGVFTGYSISYDYNNLKEEIE